jgi:adenosylcobyric acid synthase
LRAEPGVTVTLIHPGTALPGDADLVLLPGSKATIADLDAFRAEGWDIDLAAHIRRGGRVLGICGGYQMLGHSIADPEGIEGPPVTVAGLGLLNVDTVLTADKRLTEITGIDRATGVSLRAYEMHVGVTTGPGAARPMIDLDGRAEGAVSADGRVAGCYLHGLFAADAWRRAFLAQLGAVPDPALDYDAGVEATLDRLADHLDRHLDIGALLEIAYGR